MPVLRVPCGHMCLLVLLVPMHGVALTMSPKMTCYYISGDKAETSTTKDRGRTNVNVQMAA